MQIEITDREFTILLAGMGTLKAFLETNPIELEQDGISAPVTEDEIDQMILRIAK